MILGQILVLALSWCLLQGSVSLAQFILGSALAVLVLVLTRGVNGNSAALRRAWAAVDLVFFVMIDLFWSSLRVAWDVLTPGTSAKPRILCIPVEDLDEVGITVLANSLTLTPGTVTLEVSADQSRLYIHSMYAEDAERARQDVIDSYGARVRAICGGKAD